VHFVVLSRCTCKGMDVLERFESSLPDHYWKPKTRLSRIDENSQSAIIVPFKIEIWPPCSFGTKLSDQINGSHHLSINLQNSDVGGSRKLCYSGVILDGQPKLLPMILEKGGRWSGETP